MKFIVYSFACLASAFAGIVLVSGDVVKLNDKNKKLEYESRTKDSLYREANTRLINHKNKCNCVCLD
jgi:hypothetical protein